MLRIVQSPDDKPIAAIGDIHGEARMLDVLLDALEDHGDSIGGLRIVTLGDHIDRGEASRAVVERLVRGPRSACNEYVHLLGNHDEMMLRAYRSPHGYNMSRWLSSGGIYTLFSYGLEDDNQFVDGVWKALIPQEHVDFLDGLIDVYADSDRIYVHAGLRPGIDLSRQEQDDTLWIREGFLDVEHDFGRTVVHGHTPEAAPEILAHRINLDTEACRTGRLTAAVFGPTMRIVQALQPRRSDVPVVEWSEAPAPRMVYGVGAMPGA